MLSEFSPDICPWSDIAMALACLRMGKMDVYTYKYVIMTIIIILYMLIHVIRSNINFPFRYWKRKISLYRNIKRPPYNIWDESNSKIW